MAGANRKFERRFNEMERLLAKDGLSLEEASLDAMEERWRGEVRPIKYFHFPDRALLRSSALPFPAPSA